MFHNEYLVGKGKWRDNSEQEAYYVGLHHLARLRFLPRNFVLIFSFENL